MEWKDIRNKCRLFGLVSSCVIDAQVSHIIFLQLSHLNYLIVMRSDLQNVNGKFISPENIIVEY